MNHFLFFAFLVISITGSVSAQDKIVRKNKADTLFVKVLEVGSENIRFRYENDTVVSAIRKIDVFQVHFADGHIVHMVEEVFDTSSYIMQKRRAIKWSFTAPLFDQQSVYYEWSNRPGRSLEAGATGYGIGINTLDDNDKQNRSKGVRLQGGIKFMNLPLFRDKSFRFSHLLSGTYFKPEVYFSLIKASFYSYMNQQGNFPQSTSSERLERKTFFQGAAAITIGHQTVYTNLFVMDVFGSLGFSFSHIFNPSTDRYYSDNYSSFLSFPVNNPSIFVNMGIKLGILY